MIYIIKTQQAAVFSAKVQKNKTKNIVHNVPNVGQTKLATKMEHLAKGPDISLWFWWKVKES